MPEHHIIYIPGLGDPNYKEQGLLLKLWHIHRVHVHYHSVHWREDRPFTEKLDKMLEQIDNLKLQGHIVSLVGTSAGASAVINAYAKRQSSVSGVVCICGKLRNTQTISERTFDMNPAFKHSLAILPTSLAKLDKSNLSKILSIHPLHDGVVPVSDTFIDGAKSKTIPTIGHVLSIVYALTFGSRTITQFLKNQAVRH